MGDVRQKLIIKNGLTNLPPPVNTCNSTGTLNGAGVNFNVLAYCVTCDVWIASVISLLPTLKDALHAQLNAEAITAELRTRLVVVVNSFTGNRAILRHRCYTKVNYILISCFLVI